MPGDDGPRHREGLAWALLGVGMFSFSVPLTKVAVGGFDAFLTATGRAAIAGALAAGLLVARAARAVRGAKRCVRCS